MTRFLPILFLIPVLSSCGNPAQKFIGTWALKEMPGQTWQFTNDGTVWFHTPRPTSNIELERQGTFTVKGNSLILNMSDKNVASSFDPSQKATADVISGQPAIPIPKTWTINENSPTELIITANESGEKVTYTLDRQGT